MATGTHRTRRGPARDPTGTPPASRPRDSARRAPVALRDVSRALDVSGEEAPPEGRVRDERDAELAQRRERLLRLGAIEQTEFVLDGRDRMDPVGATDRCRRSLGESEEAHLAAV